MEPDGGPSEKQPGPLPGSSTDGDCEADEPVELCAWADAADAVVLATIDGVEAASVNLATASATVSFDPARTSFESLEGARTAIVHLYNAVSPAWRDIVFRITQDMLGPSSLVFGFSPAYASLLPIGVSVLAGIFLLRKHL